MLLLNSRKSNHYKICRKISIHLMLLLNPAPIEVAVNLENFNTSNVTIKPVKPHQSVYSNKYFNTSNVTINITPTAIVPANFLISIHLMLLLNPVSRSCCHDCPVISIHLMLLLNNNFCC